MDFFQAQEHAQRRTSLLVVLFGAAVLAIISTIYAAVHLGTGRGLGAPFQPLLFAVIAGGVLLLVGAGSAFRTMQLRRGGPAVAELLGGRRVAMSTTRRRSSPRWTHSSRPMARSTPSNRRSPSNSSANSAG